GCRRSATCCRRRCASRAAAGLAASVPSLSTADVSGGAAWAYHALTDHQRRPEMSATAIRSALIVIDVQESFRYAPYWREDDLPAFRAALLRLDAGCRARGVPVVHVFHVGQAGPFAEDSGLIRAFDWLPGKPAAVFHKHTHNAFTDTGLDLWLRRRGIGRLIISGIRTEQCCETTARVGADIGYQVDFVTAATLTFPM